MGTDGPTFVPKSGYFLLIWVNVCPQKLAFLNFFIQFYKLFFFGKMLALSNKKSTFVLAVAFWLLYFHTFVQILFERSLFN